MVKTKKIGNPTPTPDVESTHAPNTTVLSAGLAHLYTTLMWVASGSIMLNCTEGSYSNLDGGLRSPSSLVVIVILRQCNCHSQMVIFIRHSMW